jgi:hypothetical protein
VTGIVFINLKLNGHHLLITHLPRLVLDTSIGHSSLPTPSGKLSRQWKVPKISLDGVALCKRPVFGAMRKRPTIRHLVDFPSILVYQPSFFSSNVLSTRLNTIERVLMPCLDSFRWLQLAQPDHWPKRSLQALGYPISAFQTRSTTIWSNRE